MSIQRWLIFLAAMLIAHPSLAQQAPAIPSETLFRNVRLFDGKSSSVLKPTDVLVRGNVIAAIGAGATGATATVIDGKGRTLMPGMIDAHTHIMMANITELGVLTSDIGFLNLAAARTAEQMLMHGFTSIREAGGPAFALKRAIDMGLVAGPRIWPTGAMISQTSGHGDFRLPGEVPAVPGVLAYSDRMGFTAIADSPDLVRQRVREQLRQGASQIKLMAGGGVSSLYDPLDVTQFSPDEMRAAVEAAADWGTYVMAHVYNPRGIRRAVEAGVKSIEHGHLIDEPTAKLMAERGVWWSLQPFLDDEDANPKEGAARLRQMITQAGTDIAYNLAKKFRIKTAWGTDTLFAPGTVPRMNFKVTKLTRWYTPGEVLRMVTGQNGELLALAGQRSPYGRVGVIEPGAMADLILVDGDPVADIRLIEDPERRFLVIMKDGKVFKNNAN